MVILLGVRQGQERHGGDGGEDQEMQTHPDDEVEMVHQSEQLPRAVVPLQDMGAVGRLHAGDHRVGVPDVVALHGHEDDLGGKAVHDEVGRVREQLVVAVLVEVGRRPPRSAHRHAREHTAGVDPLTVEHLLRERLGSEQQRGIRRHLDVPLQAHVFEHPLRHAVTDRDAIHRPEHLAYPPAILALVQRTGADGERERRDVLVLCNAHVAQVQARLVVVEDAPAAEQEQIQRSISGATSYRWRRDSRRPDRRRSAPGCGSRRGRTRRARRPAASGAARRPST